MGLGLLFHLAAVAARVLQGEGLVPGRFTPVRHRSLARDAQRAGVPTLAGGPLWKVLGNIPADSWPKLAFAEELGEDLRARVAPYGAALRVCGAVVSEPQSADAWSALGELCWERGRFGAAIAALERAAALAPEDAAVQVELAKVLRSAGQFPPARASLLRAEEISGLRDQALSYSHTVAPGAVAPPCDEVLIQGSAVRQTRVASPAECAWVIQTAEAAAARRGGWDCRQPRYAPAGTEGDAVRAPDMIVASDPELLRWMNEKLEATIWPTLLQQFGVPMARMWLYDVFLLKFDGATPQRSGLDWHVDDDGLGLSFNLLLSPPGDFEGGGTRFDDQTEDGRVFEPEQGEMLSHAGGLRHASVPTRAGLRYILVGFVRLAEDG